MRFKLDENLPRGARARLAERGWDVHDVHEENLVGADDVRDLSCTSHNLLILAIVGLGLVSVPSTAIGQTPAPAASIAVALQVQDASSSQAGIALSAGGWLPTTSLVHPRIEVGVAMFNGGVVGCFDGSGGCARAGDPVLVASVTGGVAIGRAPGTGVAAEVGVSVLQGRGGTLPGAVTVLAPDFGLFLPLGRVVFLESRYRWAPAWKGRDLRQFSIGLGWLRR